jgi:hypothetical protein
MPALVFASCSDTGRERGDIDGTVLTAIDTLVTTTSEIIGGVYDLAVSPHGDVRVADYGFKHVVVVSPDGTIKRRIGKPGPGPGEFSLPYVVSAGADSVRVFDVGTELVQVFGETGVVARSYRLGSLGLGGGRDFRDDGYLAVAIDGREGAMILVLDAVGRQIAKFGNPVVPPVSGYDFAALKSEIREGRVPNSFRNTAVVKWAPDHSIYLAFLAEPQVRRYDATGTLLWTRKLNDPVLRSARKNFVRKNIDEKNPSRIHPLQYLTDLAVLHDNLWLLLNTEDEENGLLLVLNGQDGSILHRITFPGLPNTGFFGVDVLRKRLYMAPRDEASILIFELPGY